MSEIFYSFADKSGYNPEQAKHSSSARACVDKVSSLLYNFDSEQAHFEHTSVNGFSRLKRCFEYYEAPQHGVELMTATDIEVTHSTEQQALQDNSYSIVMEHRTLDGKSSRAPIRWSYMIEDFGHEGGVQGWVKGFDALTNAEEPESRLMTEYDFKRLVVELKPLEAWQDAQEHEAQVRKKFGEDWRQV